MSSRGASFMEIYDSHLQEISRIVRVLEPITDEVSGVLYKNYLANNRKPLTMDDAVNSAVIFLKNIGNLASFCIQKMVTIQDVVKGIADTIWLFYCDGGSYSRYVSIKNNAAYTCSFEIEEAILAGLKKDGLLGDEERDCTAEVKKNLIDAMRRLGVRAGSSDDY